jgi:hypothetical protein
MQSARDLLGPHTGSPVDVKARLEAHRRGEPYLLFRDPGGSQHIVALDRGGGRRTVGRAPAADVSLAWDERVSRVHAELEAVSDDWTVIDNGLSRNGTFVNGERVSGRRRLRDGDVITFGSTPVAFQVPVPGGYLETLDAPSKPPPTLSEAQRRVLIALCRPCRSPATRAAPATNRQIAEELVLTVAGVKSNIRSLFERFAVEDLPQNSKRARLVELAFETGVVTSHDFEL